MVTTLRVVSCFPDIEWKLIAKTVINSDVIFLQATGDADGAPGRAALFPQSFGRDAGKRRTCGKQVIESRIGTDMRSVKEIFVFWIETIKNLNQVTAVVP